MDLTAVNVPHSKIILGLNKIGKKLMRDGKLIKEKGKTCVEIPLDSIENSIKKGKFAIRSRLEKLESYGIMFKLNEEDSKIKISFSEEHRGLPISYVLKAYIQFLLENNGERKAYTLFSKGDMSQYMK